MINVTKNCLSQFEEYVEHLRKIWESGQVVYNGPLVRELEQKLTEDFGVKHLFQTTNGILGLQIALRSLNISMKVITTPFSYEKDAAVFRENRWERARVWSKMHVYLELPARQINHS